MLQGLIDYFTNLSARQYVNIALVVAALGIAGWVFVGNGGSRAAECRINDGARQAIDAVAVGELAALQATADGRSYADLSFVDDTGRPMTLADFSGRALLVNFWATWCGPCREEMPALDNLSADLGGDSFAVVPINLDLGSDGIDKAQQFLDEMGLPNLPLLADPTFEAFERLKENGVALGLPATLLLDDEGCELAVLQGPAHWDSPQAHDVIEVLVAQSGG